MIGYFGTIFGPSWGHHGDRGPLGAHKIYVLQASRGTSNLCATWPLMAYNFCWVPRGSSEHKIYVPPGTSWHINVICLGAHKIYVPRSFMCFGAPRGVPCRFPPASAPICRLPPASAPIRRFPPASAPIRRYADSLPRLRQYADTPVPYCICADTPILRYLPNGVSV